ncbi:hypothetical protein F5Y01DRAFT_314984 [Xylaria sp. FL0043]|nr:hypothetical protein F5Y01DRAFT_314984 [Xylaria sp. FL0043]
MSVDPLMELQGCKGLEEPEEFEEIEGRNDPKGLDQMKEPGEEGERSKSKKSKGKKSKGKKTKGKKSKGKKSNDKKSNGNESSGNESNGRQIERGNVFHRFMDLPAELRLEIWELALLEPYRLTRFYPRNSLTCGPGCFLSIIFNSDVFDMPLAHVCAESRAFVFDYGYRPAGPHMWRYSKSYPQFCRCLDNVDNLSEDIQRAYYYDD